MKIRLFSILLLLNVFFLAAEPLKDNSALCFGNPSAAEKSEKNRTNYLLEKKQYILSYNAETLIPNWVMWHLDSSDMGQLSRSNDFRSDETLPENFYAVKKSDYKFNTYGFDRGHLCPSADRTSDSEDNSATFLMTNMIPQTPDLNRIVWKDLESYARQLSESGKELYAAAGPCGKGGTSAKGHFDFIEINKDEKILVPAYCWKIILVLENGDDDFSRVNKDSEVIAVFMPNEQKLQAKGSWKSYLTNVDYIEELTGFDFFSELPDEIENAIEAKIFDSEKETQ